MLPIEKKQEIFSAQHNLTVAQANQANARQAVEQARTFAELAKAELQAARARLEAARTGVTLAERERRSPILDSARQQLEAAQSQLEVARAKHNYAEELVKLREAEAELTLRRIDAAKDELALVKASVLQRNDIPPNANVQTLAQRSQRANRGVAALEQRLTNQRTDVSELRESWQRKQRRSNLAARQRGELVPLPPPPPARQIPAVPLDREEPSVQSQGQSADAPEQTPDPPTEP